MRLAFPSKRPDPVNNPESCTVIVGVDNYYLNKLVITYGSWLWCHPEIIKLPLMLVYDKHEINEQDPRVQELRNLQAEAANHFHVTPGSYLFFGWGLVGDGISQREEMLTGLVACTKSITSPYYMKIDADSFGSQPNHAFCDPKWFQEDFAYIAPKWGYTKPAGTVARIDKWAEGIPYFQGTVPLGPKVIPDELGRKDNHERMCSPVMFGNTAWSRAMWDLVLAKGQTRLPFPSQDTFLSYCAVRKGLRHIPFRYKNAGWDHCRNIDGLRDLAKKGELLGRRGHCP